MQTNMKAAQKNQVLFLLSVFKNVTVLKSRACQSIRKKAVKRGHF